jgi:hypothetical protein
MTDIGRRNVVELSEEVERCRLAPVSTDSVSIRNS